MFAVLFGVPLAGLVVGASGAMLEAAKLLVTVAKRRHSFHKLQRDHSLAYLIDAKQRIEGT